MPVHGLAISPKRRGDEQRLHDILLKLVSEDPACGWSTCHHQRDGGLRPGRAAPAHAAGAADRGAQLPGGNAAAAHRLPRDRHRAGRGPPPPQEADRRRRPVRRGLPARRAAAARQRLPVRRRGQGGTIPNNFMPAVEKGVRQAMEEGVVAGYPVVDLKCVVYDGKHHTGQQGNRLRHRRQKALIAGAGGAALRAGADRARRSARPNRTWATSPATSPRAAAR